MMSRHDEKIVQVLMNNTSFEQAEVESQHKAFAKYNETINIRQKYYTNKRKRRI